MPYKDPEKRREYKRDQMRRLYASDPEKYRAQSRDRQARLREEDPEGIRARKRAWRAASPEKVRTQKRASNVAHPETRKAWLAANQKRGRIDKMFSTHGLRPADWAQIFAAQDGRCCYCRRPLNPEGGTETAVDHDHSCTCGPKKSCSACRRGLACANCNRIIGLAAEDPERLEVIAASLRVLAAAARERINGKPVQGELFPNVTPIRREAAG